VTGSLLSIPGRWRQFACRIWREPVDFAHLKILPAKRPIYAVPCVQVRQTDASTPARLGQNPFVVQPNPFQEISPQLLTPPRASRVAQVAQTRGLGGMVRSTTCASTENSYTRQALARIREHVASPECNERDRIRIRVGGGGNCGLVEGWV
jgi:hypothetical protein